MTAQVPPLTDAEVVALGEGFAVVRDEVLGLLADAVRVAAISLAREGVLSPAGVGAEGVVRRGLRGDLTAWVADRVEESPWGELCGWYDALRLALNEAAMCGTGTPVTSRHGFGLRVVAQACIPNALVRRFSCARSGLPSCSSRPAASTT